LEILNVEENKVKKLMEKHFNDKNKEINENWNKRKESE
jgi:hypothetical protein